MRGLPRTRSAFPFPEGGNVSVFLHLLVAPAARIEPLSLMFRFSLSEDHRDMPHSRLHPSEHLVTDESVLKRLPATASPDEVVELAKEFLSGRMPHEFAKLPRDCRPPLINSPADIGAYAFMLVSHRCLNEHDGNVARMADFFSATHQHLSLLLAETPRSGSMRARSNSSVSHRECKPSCPVNCPLWLTAA